MRHKARRASAVALMCVMMMTPSSLSSPHSGPPSAVMPADSKQRADRRGSAARLLALRGGGDDLRSRRRLVKGKRSLEVPAGFFGKPPATGGASEGTAGTAAPRQAVSSGAADSGGNPFSSSQGNPFASPAAGGSAAPPSGGNPFGAPATAGGNPFASSAAAFVASPFGAQPASPRPALGFGGAGSMSTQVETGGSAGSGVAGSSAMGAGFSGMSAIGAPGETSQPAAGNPFNPFLDPASRTSLATYPAGTSFGGTGFSSPFSNMTSSVVQPGPVWSSPLLGSAWSGFADGGAGGNASGAAEAPHTSVLSPASTTTLAVPAAPAAGVGFVLPGQSPAQGHGTSDSSAKAPVAVSMNPFADISSLRGKSSGVANPFGGMAPPSPAPWDLNSRLNASSSSPGVNPFGAGLAKSVADGGGLSGTRIERGKPIFNLSGVGGFSLLGQSAITAADGAAREGSTEAYTGMTGEGEVHEGEFLGLAKGGVANFGFIKPVAPAGGGGGTGNIFVHKSNLKPASVDLAAGQRVRYRLAPHDTPGFGAAADAPRVQAVEVEVQAAAHMEKQGTEPTTTKTGSDAGGPRADVDEGDAEWRCETCMVMNKATVKKCICCESPRPHVADHAPTTVASAAPVNDLGVAAGSDSSGGFHFPASTTQQPLFGQAPPSTTPRVEHTGTGPLAPAGKRRHQNEDEDDEEGAQADHCDRKRRGTAGESLQTPSSTSITVVKASETAVGVENAEVPRVLGSPRLLGYSCLTTDLEAATAFLQEVAGMHVRRHDDYFQTPDGGLGYDGRSEAADWSKTLLSYPGASDLSMTLELVHVRALESHRIDADLTEVVLASTPALRRLRQRRPEWDARGWVPLETPSGLVLRVPGTALAIKVVPSQQGLAGAYSSGGRRAPSPAGSDLVAVALPTHDLEAAQAFYRQVFGMQAVMSAHVRGAQVALSFGTLGPRLLLVSCPALAASRVPSDGVNIKARVEPALKGGLDYGDLGCSPPWRAGSMYDGGGAREHEVADSHVSRPHGLGVPASSGRLIIGATKPVLHALTGRAAVYGHTSLVPLSTFPGPCRTRLALAVLQSPDGHEVASVEKDALLTCLASRPSASQRLADAIAAMHTVAAAAEAPVVQAADQAVTRSATRAADPPMETPPRFVVGDVKGADVAGDAGGNTWEQVRMFSQGPRQGQKKTRTATVQAARLALSCSPPAVSGALLHARYAVEWQASGYFVDGIESQGRGLHVVWRHQSDSKSVDCDQEHDIEAIDSVQIEGVECVFQIERDSALEAQYSDGDTQDDRGVFLAVNDPQGRALLQSLVEGLQEDPGLLNHRRILLPRAVYTY